MNPRVSDAPATTPVPAPTHRQWQVRLLVSLLVAGAFLLFMRRGGVPLLPKREYFEFVKWWTVPTYFASLLIVHWFRAWRWNYLLRPVAKVPTSRIIAYAWVGFFAIMMLPLRMGEVVRPILLRREGNISGSAALGTIAAERVLDGLFVALLLAATLRFVPRPPLEGVTFSGIPVQMVVHYGYLTVAVFSAALFVLGFFLAARRLAERLTAAIVGLVSQRLATRLSRMVGDLADGLRSLPDPKLMGPFLLQTAIYWTVNALGMWLLGYGCGLPMTPAQGFAVMGVLAMGILLPAGPGLFGPFQYSIFLALMLYFPEHDVRTKGSVYVFLMYACQFVFTSIAGIGSLLWAHIDPRTALDEAPASVPPPVSP
ncbi:MAG: hypothetical protein JWM10_4908 [Myxococcaceae bacterium]|nr:hypothetical protein [Myxococcaceae bacterium]